MARILIVDDEASIRRTLREILEYEKYKVDDASTGIEALKLLNEQEYEVILCDIKMPEMDGIELLQEIKQLCDTPVIMISGHGTIETAVDAIKKGAYDYIS
ncbi:MAG TPA: response regulator, partial [Bacteroidales bacterium]|nr:response regulator [Bacteroidales bacterium]